MGLPMLRCRYSGVVKQVCAVCGWQVTITRMLGRQGLVCRVLVLFFIPMDKIPVPGAWVKILYPQYIYIYTHMFNLYIYIYIYICIFGDSNIQIYIIVSHSLSLSFSLSLSLSLKICSIFSMFLFSLRQRIWSKLSKKNAPAPVTAGCFGGWTFHNLWAAETLRSGRPKSGRGSEW